MTKKNSVKMVIDKTNLTVKFECDGDIWKWLNKKANRNSSAAYKISEDVRSAEVHDFAYDMHLDKFVRKYKEKVDEIVVA